VIATLTSTASAASSASAAAAAATTPSTAWALPTAYVGWIQIMGLAAGFGGLMALL